MVRSAITPADVERLDDVLSFAVENEHCDFFRDHLDADRRSVETVDDVLALPTMGKEDLRAYDGEFRFMPIDEMAMMFSSGGTTGEAVPLQLSERDWDRYVRDHSTYHEHCLSGRERVLVMTSHTLAQLVRESLRELGHAPIMGDPQDLAYSRAMAMAGQVTVLQTSPSMALQFGEMLDDAGFDLSTITTLGVGQEPLTPLLQEQLHEMYPGADLVNLYGAGEFGTLTYQCEHLYDTCTLHTTSDDLLYEVLDPETGEPVAEGEEGELVVSNLHAPTFQPFIRWRTGDLVELVTYESTCDCGADGIVIDLRGRAATNMVAVADMRIYRDAIETGIEAAEPFHTGEYQVHVHEKRVDGDIRPYFRVQLVPGINTTPDSGTAERVADIIMDNLPLTADHAWRRGVEKGVLGEIEVEFVDTISYDDEIKRKRLIDHRSEEGQDGGA